MGELDLIKVCRREMREPEIEIERVSEGVNYVPNVCANGARLRCDS